jgi:hypothetical protein
MLKQDEHMDLHGLGHRNLISYVHDRELYCCVCALFKAKMNLISPPVCPAFYNSRPGVAL